MKHIRIFTLGCLYLGSFVSLPFGLKAEGTKVVKVTFDAKDYQSDRDWKKFIEALCETLKQHPDYGKTDKTFDVNITNGAVLGTDPQSLESYFENDNEREQIEEVLSKISRLEADTERFSLLSLKRIFADATEIHLLNTKTVTDSLEGCAEKLNLIFHRSFTLENNLTWSQFIERIREELGKYPDDKRIRFRLNFENGLIFGQAPEETDYRDYLNKAESEQTEITKILSRIELLQVNTKHFSTLSLTKVFPWTRIILLPNAERISGVLKETSFGIRNVKDLRAMQNMVIKPGSRLQIVYAPEVTEIQNATFFNFRCLKAFNVADTLKNAPLTERPAIVCTPLAAGYFEQDKIPENTRIAPVTVEKVTEKFRWGKRKGEIKETYYRYGGKTVRIGACAFQLCTSLQHVSAHASLIGSAAFAASGLRSAHLLLSETAAVGDDVFFNCFNLKECLMMLGRAGSGQIDSFFNGLFWNCYALETVCMPNMEFLPWYDHGKISIRKIPDNCQGKYTIFDNCFSLKKLDLRLFHYVYSYLLPCGIKQSNHELLGVDYRSSYLASINVEPKLDKFPPSKKDYIERCCKETNEPLVFIGHKDAQKYKHALGEPVPCCDVELVTFVPERFGRYSCDPKLPSVFQRQPIHLNNSDFHTLIEVEPFNYKKKDLYDETFLDLGAVFGRFNDAYRQWFVEEVEKPKNDLLNKKRKNLFVLHGG